MLLINPQIEQRVSNRVKAVAMRQQVSKELYGYWSRLKGARAAPERADIDPGAIRGVLADTFIIEVDSAGEFPIRLSGTRLNALWLRDQKSAPFIGLWREEDRRAIAAALLTVIDGVTPVIAGVRARRDDMSPLDMELLLLPLRHFGKTHSRVLGALSPSHQPDWLGHESAGALELLSLRILQRVDEPRVSAPVARRHYGRAGDFPAPISQQRPRLVVYEGGKSL